MLSGPDFTSISRKGIDPSVLGSSAVNCMLGSMEMMCSKNCVLWSVFWMKKVSSTYLFHSLGRSVAVLMALVSNHSMKRLASNVTNGWPHGCYILLLLTPYLGSGSRCFETELHVIWWCGEQIWMFLCEVVCPVPTCIW